MDEESKKKDAQKKNEMIIISPQELAQLGLLKKLPTNEQNNLNAPSTSTGRTDNVEVSNINPQPIVLNHVLRIKSPLVNVRRVFAKRMQGSPKILNPNVVFKKNNIIIAKKPSAVLSKDAGIVKNILLSSVKTNKEDSLATNSSNSSETTKKKTTVIIQRRGIFKKAIKSHGIIKAQFPKDFQAPTITKKFYKKNNESDSKTNNPHTSTSEANNSNAPHKSEFGTQETQENALEPRQDNMDAHNLHECIVHSLVKHSEHEVPLGDNLEESGKSIKNAADNSIQPNQAQKGNIVKPEKKIKILSNSPIKIPSDMLKNLFTETKMVKLLPNKSDHGTVSTKIKRANKQNVPTEPEQKEEEPYYKTFAEAQEAVKKQVIKVYDDWKKQNANKPPKALDFKKPQQIVKATATTSSDFEIKVKPEETKFSISNKQEDDNSTPMKKRSRKDHIIMKLDDQFESVETEVLISGAGQHKAEVQEKLKGKLSSGPPLLKKYVGKTSVEKDKGSVKNTEVTTSSDAQVIEIKDEKSEGSKKNNPENASKIEVQTMEKPNEDLENKNDPENTDLKKDEVVKKKGRPKKKPVETVDVTKTSEAEIQELKQDEKIKMLHDSINSDPTISNSGTKLNLSEQKKDDVMEMTSNIPVVQPRKRGRPRKYPKVDKSDTLNPIMETSLDHFEEKIKVLNSELELISDKSYSSDTSPTIRTVQDQKDIDTPIQKPLKKRGRKKKSEKLLEEYGGGLTADDLDSLTKAGVFEEVEIEVSKSGRKRKKINYFDMENNFIDEDLMERKVKKQKLSTGDQENEKIKNEKSKAKVSEEASIFSLKEENVIEENYIQTEKEQPKEINEEEKEQSEGKEMNEEKMSDDQGKKDDNSGKKYKYTGETTKMMKSIFSAAFKDSLPKDGHDAEKSTLKRRGRKKLNEESGVIIDEEEKVTCTACKEKILNQNWVLHNRYVHYNLSWREGENFLNIDDELFLKRTLKPILQEDKKLVCYKCKASFQTVGEYIFHKEECEGTVLGGQVTCAICKEQMEKTKWSFHKRRKHNNLAWRDGDPSLDLSNQSLVLDILNNLYKAKIPLYCYKCNISKKSVVGYLSHQAQCGISEEEVKIKCPHCPKKILPVSLHCHIKMVHTKKDDTPNKAEKYLDEKEQLPGKRQAAKNALAMIDSLSKRVPVYECKKSYCNQLGFEQNVIIRRCLKKEIHEQKYILCKFENCETKCESFDTFWDHLNACEYKALEYYVCNKCCAIRITEEKMKDHLEKEHKINVLTDDNATSEEDEELEMEELRFQQSLVRKRRSEKIKIMINKSIKLKPRFISTLQHQSIKKLFQCAFEYTLEFCNEHFTQSVLFDSLRYLQSEWNLLEEERLPVYLPKHEESCDVSRLRVRNFENVLGIEHKFKKFELFEVEQQKGGVTTIFCGGPISAMAWLPTPHILLRCTQILAVAVLNDFDSKYYVNSNYNEPSVIQFWDCGILKNRIRPIEPELLFCLAVDCGPIWHLEWCPSGCYDEVVPNNKTQKRRMGLLAVAGASADVCIYAVPFLEEQEKGLVYKNKPLLKLRIAVSTDNFKKNHYPTKISWSKASKHKYIAVGYTDGMVAVFNLDTTSQMLKFKDQDGVETLLPCKTIKAHTHYISVLSLVHHGGGARWLLTGSFDSNVFLWDLMNNTKSLYTRKKIVSDGAWLTNWVAYITTIDESNTRHSTINTGVISHRNYLYEPAYIMSSPSTLTTVSSSDWLNGIINANGEGEIIASFLPQLIYSLDNYKRLKNHRFLMGFSNLIDKHKSPEERVSSEMQKQQSLTPIKSSKTTDTDSSAFLFSASKNFCNEYEPLTYKEAKETYALVFCDMILNNFDDFSEEQQDKLSTSLCSLQKSRPNLYPLRKVNKICFNPNCQASLYYATGYQAGFVRLSYVKFLENDKQVV